jgi:nitrate reductase gamma subunit
LQEATSVHDARLTTFWIVHLALLGLFGLEVAFILSVWLKARVPGLPTNAPRWRKLGAALGHGASLVFSRRIVALLGALIVDGMLHRRLYHISLRRWAVHLAVFGSWLALGILSTLTGIVVEILPLLGMSPDKVAALPVIGHLYHADVWWVALLNEVLGLVVLCGMLLVVYRRAIQKDPQLRTLPADNIVIGLLILIAAGGFPTETLRLLADYTTAAGAFAPDPTLLSPEKLPPELYHVWGPQWGFVGYSIAQALGTLKLSPALWELGHNLFFWLHVLTVTALLYYLPFSRFFHVIMSPVIVAFNSLQEHDRREKAGVGMPQSPLPDPVGGESRG